MNPSPNILCIESSCDDTSIAVTMLHKVKSNIVSSQLEHQKYGGVVPEIASREHIKQIIPLIDLALSEAQLTSEQIDAIAFTQGPGLMGSLLVGVCTAKALAQGWGVPMIPVDHLQAHVYSAFMDLDEEMPDQFLSLVVSGGHTSLYLQEETELKLIGKTRDDAAGEAFDKIGKMLGLPYPAGIEIDTLATQGDSKAFAFPIAKIPDYDYSFSGLKTAVLYFLQKQTPDFISQNLADICASIQYTIVETLVRKLQKALDDTSQTIVVLGGGVSNNSYLRSRVTEICQERGIRCILPKPSLTTDNAAMLGLIAYRKFIQGEFGDFSVTPYARAQH